MQAEFFDGLDRMLPRQRVHGVFHGVRRQDLAVVAFCVRGLEVAFKTDRQSQLFDVVAALLPRHAQQPDARFSVIVFTEMNGHVSAPAIRGISERAQQQRNVIVLRSHPAR